MAKLHKKNINRFLMLKLPSAWLCGVRVHYIEDEFCKVGVRHRWINQNPFHSVFWAVQGMAAELATGALVMTKIQHSGKKISMLVANDKANFSKKAKGKIVFSCNEGKNIDEAIEKTITTGDGQTFWMRSVGKDASGDIVSTFDFEWTIKVKL